MFNRNAPLLVKARIWAVGIASPRVSFLQTRAVASAIDDEFLASCCQSYVASGKALPAFLAPVYGSESADEPQTGAVGDFLAQLLAWLSSPEGMAFIKFIFSLFSFTI